VVQNDGFAKAKAIENKQELVVEHAQKIVKNTRSVAAAATVEPGG
jgi:hypothetical protein